MSENRTPPTSARLSRRTALGMLGASALAAGGAALIVPGIAEASGGDDQPQPVPPGLRPGGEFDQLVRQQAEQDLFSGNVLLAYRGRPVLSRSYGMADKAQAIPNAPNTRFLLASVTKAMTATAVVQLVERGELALPATLGTYLGGFPTAIADTVTLHQLLTMTSGMGNYSDDPAWFPTSKTWTTAAQVLDGTMAFVRNQPLRFTPGTQYFYSNSGFVTLGAIVQQVSGQSYWDYMREHIFGPAGMGRTDFYTRPQVLALDAKHEVAHPFAASRSGGRTDVFSLLLQFIGLPDGAGGPHTTAPDMVSFASALQDGRLVDAARAREILSGKFPVTPSEHTNPGVPPNVASTWQSWMIGYGLEDTIIDDQHVLGHSGNGPGQATGLDIYPDLDWVSVILENYDLAPFGTSTEVSPIAQLERRLITQSSREEADRL
jgi:CubicO group peptidase (beta-lactamase class C family)